MTIIARMNVQRLKNEHRMKSLSYDNRCSKFWHFFVVFIKIYSSRGMGGVQNYLTNIDNKYVFQITRYVKLKSYNELTYKFNYRD